MTQITKNFKLSEFDCRCGCTMPPEVKANIIKLVKGVLQPLRDFLGRSITINSGYRCKTYNTKIGGAKKSQHMKGTAGDFTIEGLHPRDVYKILDIHMKNVNELGPGGVGNYYSFTHVDIREATRPVRWTGS